MFLQLTPPEHWCSAPPEAHEALIESSIRTSYDKDLISYEEVTSLYSDTMYRGFNYVERVRNLTIPRTKDGTGFEKCHMYAPNWTQVSLDEGLTL